MTDTHDCNDCPLSSRRDFVRDAAAAVAAAFLTLGAGPRGLSARTLGVTAARLVRGDERTYPLPAEDGASIDRDAEVILVRYQGKVYAFALSCPHQHTALHWEPDKARFQCPKHHSKYQPDGVYVSGRATRSMDRHALRRDAASVVVDLGRLYREDRDADAWKGAFVTV
ncbi:MAG TPA: Rieske 2Fe-2S domain-containing protein [Gemmatimonadales bacterium]|jgi:Rieske Fe-S protein|nr:Rieske 2Fe-2S domain-containing protein [Gemmatimonadales bacterium]